MQLGTLFKQTKTGAIQQYTVAVEGDEYIITQGQVGGKMQEYRTTCKPKNVGKANETTGADQALSEGCSRLAKKAKTGYTEDPSGEVHVKLPMKVQTYSKHKKKVIFPCYESPKLNGVNATYRINGEELALTSRGGENYPLIEQHLEDIRGIMQKLYIDELNGEIYIHGVPLQSITSSVKKYNHFTPSLEFHIFDIPNAPGDYKERLKLLDEIEDTEFVKVVPVGLAYDHTDLDNLHDHYAAQGYEGLMIRNATGEYVHNTRSNDVFKLKKALDAEFKVINYNFDKHGHVVFVCECEGGEFKVKLKGSAEERLAMAAEANIYLGKWVKVEYEMLSIDKVPLKPVGIMFRKVGADGEALE